VRDAATTNGVSVLLVEQYVKHALRIADYVYIMRRGEIVLRGAVDEVSSRLGDVEHSYLSLDDSSP